MCFPACSHYTSFYLIFESPALFQDLFGHKLLWLESEIKIEFLYKSWSFYMAAIPSINMIMICFKELNIPVVNACHRQDP